MGYFMKKTKKIYIKTKYLMVKPETMMRYRKNVYCTKDISKKGG